MTISRNAWLIAPFAVWMTLMSVLPATASGYALRSLATTIALVASLVVFRGSLQLPSMKQVLWGVATGLVVFALWVWPEQFEVYRRFCVFGDVAVTPGESPFDPNVCGWPLTLVRLVGSAFVISVAEELFFRKWLVGFAGFWWMVALFAVEHDRWLVGALAGLAYGGLFLRRGLSSAIVAHAVTNLVLGLWIFKTGNWAFW